MSTVDPPHFPFRDHLGFTITGDPGSTTVSIDLDDRHMNPNSVAHGAVLFALMDTAMGAAVMGTLDDGRRCSTIEIQTRFLRAVTEGRLTAHADIIHSGRHIVHLEARTVDDRSRLVATATGSFAIIAEPPPA